MTDIDAALNETEQELKRFLEEDFVPIDDVPRDWGEERRIILEEKASLLLHASLWTEGMFRLFRRAKRSFFAIPEGLMGVLPGGVVTRRQKNRFSPQAVGDPPRPSFSTGVIAFSLLGEHVVNTEEQEFEYVLFLKQSGELYTDESYPVPYELLCLSLLGICERVEDGVKRRHFCQPSPTSYEANKAALDRANQELQKRSLFEVCQGLGLFDSPEEVCYLAGVEDSAFGDVFRGQSRLSPGHFGEPHGKSGKDVVAELLARKRYMGCTEADMVQTALVDQTCSGHRGMPVTAEPFEKAHGERGFWQAVHSGYRDDRGATRQKVIKLLLWDDAERVVSKVLLPRTVWRERGGWHTHQYCVPYPWDLQPLYNRRLLGAMPDAPVILTDSIEIAELNQKEGSEFVWVSWLCESERYDQVDWSPLEGRDVYLLVTNHSGRRLEEAYVKTGELLAYWEDVAEVDVLPCCFVQVLVDYPQLRCPDDWPHSVIRTYDENPPRVVDDSVILLERQDFQRNLAQAKEELRPKRRFLPTAMGKAEGDETEPATAPGGYMLWPAIKPGCTTMIYAMEGNGKTNFTLGLAASIVAGEPFVRDRCWSVPIGLEGASVIYFDFESGGDDIAESDSDFVAPFLSSDVANETDRRSRFHRIDMIEVTERAGIKHVWNDRERVFRIMKRHVDEEFGSGPFERPVLVVVDNYLALVGGADGQGKWGECCGSFFDGVKSRGAALVVVHHANAEKESAGYRANRNNPQFRVYMEKKHGTGGILENITVRVEKGRGHKSNLAFRGFVVSFKNKTKRWELDEGQDDVAEFFAKLCYELKDKTHGGKKLSITEIGEMVGLKRSTANAYVQKFRTKPGGPIDEVKLGLKSPPSLPSQSPTQ
jgi:hypothetical protein